MSKREENPEIRIAVTMVTINEEEEDSETNAESMADMSGRIAGTILTTETVVEATAEGVAVSVETEEITMTIEDMSIDIIAAEAGQKTAGEAAAAAIMKRDTKFRK